VTYIILYTRRSWFPKRFHRYNLLAWTLNAYNINELCSSIHKLLSQYWTLRICHSFILKKKFVFRFVQRKSCNFNYCDNITGNIKFYVIFDNIMDKSNDYPVFMFDLQNLLFQINYFIKNKLVFYQQLGYSLIYIDT